MPSLKSGSVLMPNVGMPQSSLMVAALIAGFVVYLAVKQKLGAYWSILMGGGSSASTASTAAPATTAPPTAAPSGGTTGSGGSVLPAPGSSGRPTFQVVPGLTITLPPNPLPTPSPGTGFGGFN